MLVWVCIQVSTLKMYRIKKIYEKADFALYQAKISEENFVILEEDIKK